MGQPPACPGPLAYTRHTEHTGSPTQGELGGGREASGSGGQLGEDFLLSPGCHSPAVSGRIPSPRQLISLLMSPPAHFLHWPGRGVRFSKTQWPKSHASVGADHAKQRKPLHPAHPKCRHSPGTPKRSQRWRVQCPYPLYMGQWEKSRCILSQLRTLLLFLGSHFPGQAEFLIICC